MSQSFHNGDPVPHLSRPAGHQGIDRPSPGLFTLPLFLRVTICAGVVCALGVVLFLPVRFPSAVSTYATIAPAHRWVLATSTDGQLIASTFNYESGLSEGFRVSTFNPGSSVYFTLHSSLAPGRSVAIGDTIGSIYSSEVAERLIALNGQLAAARSLLAVNATGQKSAIVKEAEQRLKFAKRRSDEHKKIAERTRYLFDNHLIAQGEYDLVQSEANALQDGISIAEASLESARTGAKPEQISLANANITALESEIAAVTGRASTYTLTAPISGTITPTFSEDTLLTIASAQYVALLPVRWSDYWRVAGTTEPRLTLRGLSRAAAGTVIAMNHEVQVLHGQAVLIATARLEAPPEDLMPGMLVQCRLHCTPVTAIEYGKQFLKSATASGILLGGF